MNINFFHENIDQRCILIIQKLLIHEEYVSIIELAKTLKVSRRSVYYDLEKINELCVWLNITPISVERSKGILLTKNQKDTLKDYINEYCPRDFVLQHEERIALIMCHLLSQNEPIFVEPLIELCRVSRNTIFNDLKIIRQKLDQFKLSLDFETHVGYLVQGSSIKKRAVFLYYLDIIIRLIINNSNHFDKVSSFYNEILVSKNLEKLKLVENELGINYVEGVLTSLSILLCAIEQNGLIIDLEDIDICEIEQSKEYYSVSKTFTNYHHSEHIYLAMHFLGSRVQVNSTKTPSEEMFAIAEEIVNNFEALACIKFSDYQQLMNMIAHHLQASIYRYKYGIQIGNPLIETIKESHSDLYGITYRAMQNIQKRLGYPISASEISYITMHFGGFMKSSESRQQVRIILVCPNGISTANMLKGEVEALHPYIEVVGIVSADRLEEYYGQIDFVVSTINIECKVPVIRVNPIITEEDRVRILSRVVNDAQNHKMNQLSIKRIMKVIEKYLKEEDIDVVQYELARSLINVPVKQNINEYSIRMSDLINPELIQVLDHVQDWEKAIEIAAAPLLERGSIQESYIAQMIENVKEYGPYIVIAPFVALAHALPSDGVTSLGVSILKLQNDVFFEEKPVSLVLVLAPIDNRSHLGIMKDINMLFNNKEFIHQLVSCNEPEKIDALFKRFIIEGDE